MHPDDDSWIEKWNRISMAESRGMSSVLDLV